MRKVFPLFFILVAFGCKKADEAATLPATTPASGAVTQTPPVGGRGGVAPIGSGAAGGMTPMSGTESVEGAGMGGLGQSAKDAARKAAASAGNSSMGQGTGE